MGEIALKEGAQTPTQKKKRMPGFLKFLIIFISVIVGLALLLVLAAFICFYDNSHKDVEVKAEYETSEVFNEVMVDSLDNTTVTKKMSFALAESHLNQIIYNAFKDKAEVNEYLKNFYVEAEDGNFNFFLEAQAINFVKTKVTLMTKLEITDDMMVFKINNIKIGKISGFQNLVNVLTQYISIPDLTNALASTGLNMKFDLQNLKITYALEDFYNDMLNLMGGEENDFMSIFKEIVNHDSLRTISSTGHNLFSLDVNLANLAVSETTVGIAEYASPAGYFDAISQGIMTDVIALLNSNKIQEADAQAVSNYFLGGEDLLSSSEQAVVNTYKDAGALDGYTVARYDYTGDPNDGLKNNVKTQILTQMPTNNLTINVSTADLDTMFSTSTALGKYTLFLRDKNAGTDGAKDYKINYVNIDRISVAFKDYNMFIIMSLNFNGQHGNITLKCEKQTSTAGFGVLKFDIRDLYLGDIAVSAETKASFVDLISSAMGSGSFDNLFTISDNQLTLNLKNTLDENGVLESIGYQTSFAFSANTKDTAGALIIHADK